MTIRPAAWSKLNGELRKRVVNLSHRKIRLCDLTLGKGLDPCPIEHHMEKAGILRAETAMSNAVRELLGEYHQDKARTYVRKLYTTEAKLRPDPSAGTLGVEIHSMATPKDNRILRELCGRLNETRTRYPGTNLRMIYKTVSD